jgi:GNAT superfamily N-acetyltransferase
MIRLATIEDLPRLEACAREFYASSKFLDRFDLARFVGAWELWITAGMGAVFLAEENGEVIGALGGMVYPEPYSGALIATEFFWFVRDGHRGGPGLRLYKAFEQWAREKGCAHIRMVHLMDSMPEKLTKVYARLGFEAAEVHYTKDITKQ